MPAPVFAETCKTDAAGANRFMSAVIRSTLKLLCGNRSILVTTRASEPWKMAGYFTALSSPSAHAEDDDAEMLAQIEAGRADQVAHIFDQQQVDLAPDRSR